MVADHEIFRKPFDVQLTIEQANTPPGYAKWYDGRGLPERMGMWRVQSKLKATNYGLVSDPYGFEDSPDCEWISGGVNSKGPRSAALARQGNWFLWGFCADPTEMTEEAQRVFVNTLVYMQRFDGRAPLFRREASGREWALQYATSLPKAYAARSFSDELLAAGESDKDRVMAILEENIEVLRQEKRKFVIDEEVRSLGLSNRDPALLERCIAMLESDGDQADLARKLLDRYTTEAFESAEEWRDWFGKNRSRIYFTDTGGYVFRVHDLPEELLPARYRKKP